ncbi:hypothetical protein PENSUB_4428 [Penicillium subrubescens]|uniref:Uncharacterized protein n=1 Tax=Penicillium subrubescens TaxID=1316194 RepID=A0A1Q5UBZ7_9EURO|nr:hypothetical protein PENSUB_4587 [Penicillium subrubescens]OKP10006.1 hypothetical protein PENSUB_4586 [Penicillium subrubescens]OKP10165.1 hypothetical protein PENSUB_4428 [Penicillium subrubescens]
MVPETTPDATHRVVETERITDRLQRLYKWFFFLAALLGVLAVNALTFPEFHPAQNAPAQLSHGLLCSALVTSIISAVILLMLLFEFDETASPPRSGLHVASICQLDTFLMGGLNDYGAVNKPLHEQLALFQGLEHQQKRLH